jgi:homoaconitase/3-isopropylmalate dehydratase large subunit
MNKMGQTIAEKILSKSYGSPVKIGQFIEVQPDWAFMIDDTVGLILKYLSQAGVKKLNNPERIALFYDHYAPAESAMNATDQRNGRIFAKEAGIKHFFDVGNGISHQIAIEKGMRFAIREGGRTVGAGVVSKIIE